MTVGSGSSLEVVHPGLRARSEAEVRRLFENAPIGFAATIINGSILVGILRHSIEPPLLASWWASLMGLTAIRFAHGEWFRRVASKRDFDPGMWTGSFVFGIFAAGLIWGAAAIWLLPSSSAHQTFVALILGGLVAGAAATFSVRMDAFLAFTIPALGPLAIRFLSMGDELHVAMGGMVVLFGLLLTATAHRIHALTSSSFTLSEEAEALRAMLQRSERSRVEMESSLKTQTEMAEERARRCLDDVTDAFVALQERSERRLQSRFERRTEEARTSLAVSLAQGAAYRVRETCRRISDLVRLERRETRSPAATRETLRSIEAAIERAESFVDELLAYAGGNGLDAGPTDVEVFLRSFARRWEPARPANVEVRWNWGGEPLTVRAASATLDILLRQLLENACEAVGEERGTIEVRARRVFPQEGSFVILEVLDDGAGMSQSTLDHVFDPFFSTKSRDRGLGLSVVQAIVDRHGGRVAVKSIPLRGTEVRLLLPQANPAIDSPPPEE